MLIGELTNLRAVDRPDAATIQFWLNDPELMRWWGIGAPAISLTAVLHRIERWLEDERAFGHPAAFVIETLQGEPAGLLELSDIQLVDRNAELSIVLIEARRGEGLGADALNTIADAAFEQWNLHRLTARSESDNEHAHRFFQRNGFQLEGRLREARYLDGAWSDILVFGRIRERAIER
jgi:ribosomal-protein-alanine N-acetyltransferase